MAHKKKTDQGRGKGRAGKLPQKPMSEKDAKAVKGGLASKTTEGVKKTMQTQV